ncbi:hypothetical protein SEA_SCIENCEWIZSAM_88 [Arthrobacter phage ScienceWizSam]|uniref:Uncharacterized protein n=1 Tax=Arthrobacter phage ScienceWizSam TaxID=2927283 RepID=A0A9E7P5Q0_9CAUD|nr:hypothetical protein QCN41_gp88 [Arthrobacter phage ScienceWizSam]UUG69330.1 hypothetical protein SEA_SCIENCEWIZSAM_88 [Arthrobacter phage ScienceWizSam]
MGKSSPTKLQLKHIPSSVLLGYMHWLQRHSDNNTVHFGTLATWLCPPIPEKLLLRKLQQMENRGMIESYGPACRLFRAVIR